MIVSNNNAHPNMCLAIRQRALNIQSQLLLCSILGQSLKIVATLCNDNVSFPYPLSSPLAHLAPTCNVRRIWM